MVCPTTNATFTPTLELLDPLWLFWPLSPSSSLGSFLFCSDPALPLLFFLHVFLLLVPLGDGGGDGRFQERAVNQLLSGSLPGCHAILLYQQHRFLGGHLLHESHARTTIILPVFSDSFFCLST